MEPTEVTGGPTPSIDPPAAVESGEPCSPPIPTDQFTVIEDRIVTPAGQNLPVYKAKDGTPIFRDPTGKINNGEPTSVADVIYKQAGGKLRGGANPQHAIPDPAVPGQSKVTTAQQIYKADQEKPGRGRKVTVSLETARKIKSDFYSGRATQNQMVKNKAYGGLSEPTVHSIVKGLTLWYA